jgi:hypothetical protein
MRKRSRKRATPAKRKKAEPKRDENQMAFDALQQIIRKAEANGKDPLAVVLGRRGGLKGGKVRAERMTKEARRESAQRAARARWDARKEDK